MSSSADLFNANQKFLHTQNFGKFFLLCIILRVLENCFVRFTFSITLRYKIRTYKKLEKIQADQFLIFWYIIKKCQPAVSYKLVSYMRVFTVFSDPYTEATTSAKMPKLAQWAMSFR